MTTPKQLKPENDREREIQGFSHMNKRQLLDYAKGFEDGRADAIAELRMILLEEGPTPPAGGEETKELPIQ